MEVSVCPVRPLLLVFIPNFPDNPGGHRRKINSVKKKRGQDGDPEVGRPSFCLHLLTELVRLRFQQSGLSRFCSSARALAWRVNTRRSSLRIFFHFSPSRTLMALEEEEGGGVKTGQDETGHQKSRGEDIKVSRGGGGVWLQLHL